MVNEYSKWDKLPNDILQSIFKRLGVVDRIRFDVVCKGWRTNTKQTPRLAWQLLSHGATCEQLTFFDSAESATHTFKLPEAVRGGMFVSASNGWFVVLKGTKHHVDVSLYDPISTRQIPLPSLSPIFSKLKLKRNSIIRHRFQNSATWNVNPFVQVAVSSSSSSSDAASQCMVAVRFWDDPYILASCRPQDESWTIFKMPLHYAFRHMLFCDGALYVLIKRGDPSTSGTQYSRTLGGGSHELKLIPLVIPEVISSLDNAWDFDYDPPIRIRKEHYGENFLVEYSKGKLWIVTKAVEVIRSCDAFDKDELSSVRTVRFQVLEVQRRDTALTINKLNPVDKQLVEGLDEGRNYFSPNIRIGAFS